VHFYLCAPKGILNMAEVKVDPSLTQKSAEFFSSVQPYRPLELNEFFQRVYDCVDPRDRVIGSFTRPLVAIQGPGGEIGLGQNAAIARDAEHQTGPMSAIDGAVLERKRGKNLAAYAHLGCLFGLVNVQILDEQINPSDYTRESRDRWADIQGFDLSDRKKLRIRDAMQRHRELTSLKSESQDPEEFIEHFHENRDLAYTRVIGPNLSRVHSTVLVPDIGIDRGIKRILGVQGYCDTPASLLEHYGTLPVPHTEREALGWLAISSSAATRTAVAHPDMYFFEVVRDLDEERGIRIDQVEWPN
jgi:hypothetical protein